MFARSSYALRHFSSSAAGNRVGFYGLGNMGLPMAKNLQKAGFEVTGYDISEAGRAAGEEAGIKMLDTIAAVAKDQDYIVTALPRTHDVENLLLSEGGVFESADKGTYVVDVSTISPNASKDFAKEAKK